MWKLVEPYLGEIFVGLTSTAIISIIGYVRNFFAKLRALRDRVGKLEKDLEINTRSDEELKKWIDELIKHRMKE